MTLAGAPENYALINLATMGVMLAWIVIGRAPHTALSRHLLTGVLLLFMFYPLISGPQLLSITQDGVSRWIGFGAINLHAGMLVIPALSLVAARNEKIAAPVLLAALFGAFLQPDAASGFAILGAAIGIHHVTRDWKVGVTCIVAFFASIAMALKGEIGPQPFVERVLVDAGQFNPAIAVLLALSIAATFALIAFAIPFGRTPRYALAGTLFGFVVMAMMSTYPMPLVGYGAASIIGFGIALGLHRKDKA